MMYRIPIEVVPGRFQDLMSTTVYSFRSGAQAAASRGSGLESHAVSDLHISPETSEDSLGDSAQASCPVTSI